MIQDRPTPRRSGWIAILITGVLLQGCAQQQSGPAASTARVYAADMAGGARMCQVPRLSPLDGKTVEADIKVGNDGGWCGLRVQQGGSKPYDAGLLQARPAHGDVMIHEVGDDTRIDYTPDRGFAGGDSFSVKLLPGDAVVRITVTVLPAGVAPKA